MKSILAKASSAQIVTDPFPYCVIENALDNDLYEVLSKEYPDANLMTTEPQLLDNTRYQISTHVALTENRITPAWRNFIEYHVSNIFFREVVTLFGRHIRTLYPWLESDVGKKLEDFTTGVRWRDKDVDVVLDCQPGINSAVSVPSSVRGPHVDNPVELYAALLYMRNDDDEATGGDLEIYQFKTPKFTFNGKAELDNKFVDKIGTVEYKKNSLVFFLNSLYSVHGVSIRSVTKTQRRLVNIIGEMHNLPSGGLFKLKRNKLKEKLNRVIRKFGYQ